MQLHKKPILKGLKNLEEKGEKRTYSYNGKKYFTEEIITEIRNDTEAGCAFLNTVYDKIIYFLGEK